MNAFINLSQSRRIAVSMAVIVSSFVLGILLTRWQLVSSQASGSASASHSLSSLAESKDRLTSASHSKSESTSQSEPPAVVRIPVEQWEAAGIVVEPAQASDFSKSVSLTGKITLNEDRVAHVFPMVEGTVQSVHVQLGQQVKANDLLVVIHSREVGQAKLELYQSRLVKDMAYAKDQRNREFAANTIELIKELREGVSIDKIETQFRDRPMGDYRQRLLAAYANFYKSQSDFARLESLISSGAVPAKQLVAAEATRDADRATFQASLEQIDYDIKNASLLSSQAVQESATRVAVAETNLKILGYKAEDFTAVNPAAEGERIAHYPMRAPFEGTILSKDAVLLEHVRLNAQLLSIADLSTVWVAADVYEENLPLLKSLENKTITLRNHAWPGRTFEAKVFYTGEIMDESSRTIAMRALASNTEGLLKPGMFVNVELPGEVEHDIIQIADSAIQESEGEKFVFIQSGEDVFERRDIKVGRTIDKKIEILDGVAIGDKVVTSGGFILKSNMLADLMGGE